MPTPRSPSELHSDTRRFEVICAGELLWTVAGAGESPGGLRFVAKGGAVPVSAALARRGLSVGLATTLEDDGIGRATLRQLEGAGVDTSGVRLGWSRSALVYVDASGSAQEVGHASETGVALAVPDGWSAPVTLVSGLSPVVTHEAALCHTARRARRAGSVVVVDVAARWHLWRGRDARAIGSILREADVVRCTVEDLANLGVDARFVRARMREDAVLVESNGHVWANGPFGAMARARPEPARGSSDPLIVSICAELARAGEPSEARGALWERAIARATTSMSA